MRDFDYQPVLSGELVELRPLERRDFDALYAVASDPRLWEQHPASDRHEEEGFRRFFRENLESGGALTSIDRTSGRIIGGTRFHGYSPERSEVEIGWSYLARDCWGGRYNGEIKRLMLQHAFRFVDSVVLLIGPDNIRSQKAAEKIGAVRDGMRRDAYDRESWVYRVRRSEREDRPGQ